MKILFTSITKQRDFNQFRIGDQVHFVPSPKDVIQRTANGIIKTINGDILSIVFYCQEDWKNYQNYPAFDYNKDRIRPGWQKPPSIN